MYRWLTCAFAASIVWIGVARAEQPANANKFDLNQNAALKYWRAFASLPRLSDEEQEKLRKDALTMPLDGKVKDLLEKSSGALHELHNGAKIPQCAWGVTIEDGMAAHINECQAARALSTLAVLRIRQRFAEGNHGALDDAWATLKLGRDVSKNSTIVAVLVGIAIETVVIDAVAAELPRLDARALKQFASRMDRLPPMGTVADAILAAEEPGGLDAFARGVKECKDREAVVRFLNAILDSEKSGQKGEDFLQACGGTKEGVLKLAEASRPFYRRSAEMMRLPLIRFEKEWADETKKTVETNPVLKLLAPALGKCRLAEARLEARQKLWQAAVAVQLQGREALQAHPDPFGDGPFGFVPFDGGFELRSKLKAPDKPVTLTVGKRKSD